MAVNRWTCDLCSELINDQEPRIRCLECAPEAGFDSCAKCYVQGYTAGDHKVTHRQEIFRARGYKCAAPVLPGRLETPPHLMCTTSEYAAHQYFGSLVTPDWQPTQMLQRIASAIFNYADASIEPKHAGALHPEKFYLCMDILGGAPLDNMHKRAGRLASNILTRTYELWGQDFTLDNSTSPATALLTRNGFTTELALTVAMDPDACYTHLNQAIAWLSSSEASSTNAPLLDPATNLPFRHQHVPRACFPVSCNTAVKARSEQINKILVDEIAQGKLILNQQAWQQKHPSQQAAASTEAMTPQQALDMQAKMTALQNDFTLKSNMIAMVGRARMQAIENANIWSTVRYR
ncbi:hypothetical protein BAUCODRAFT_234786 [Baudoinia panamericana UAMH 10762]|uniref:ZZ-type domain-containing protein n=1 Tax=Baudoinia panamericana (strain UAMH 10762) TaxID=717646 RepID=M2MP75_BAUPA|nr:uncharacterized protein BAUCODRAFT_234786 [Baudoinia panamericana UAMH 10762]EMC93273.1 hypothetical protein BAUCODRAFT_234786 [Baudoinia panamericana UAMH 10762]